MTKEKAEELVRLIRELAYDEGCQSGDMTPIPRDRTLDAKLVALLTSVHAG